MSDNKMRPEDLPMWLPLREGCEWDSIFNMHECFDPEYDTLPLVLLRLAFWVFAVSPRFLWWLLMLYHFRRLINTSRAVVFLQAVTAAALCLIPWIWQSDYSRLRSQTEPFFANCWQLWFLLSSPNILFTAYHLPGTVRDGIVLARDYAYRCMDLEILFPEPGEVNLDADPRDTAGEAFFKKLLTEDWERRRRKESEERATREYELAMREREREVREREVVRQKELEDRRRQRERRDEAARQEEQRRGYDPDADFSGLAAIFRRTDRRWRPRVPESEPELELARVKVQDPRSKGSRKVIAFYSRGTQTEPRGFPGERASGEASSSRYTSNGVQTDSMTEEKQHKAPASKPQEKAASSPARDPQPSRPTPTPAPESPMVKQTDEEPSERPQPPASASPRPSAPRSSASRQLVRSPTTLFGARVSTNLQGRRPRSHMRARGRLGRGRPGRLFGSPAAARGRVDETPSKSSESSTREGEQVQEQAADTTAAAAPIPLVQDAPDTTSSSFKRPEDFDDFEEWLNSSLPPSDLDGTDPFSQPVVPAAAQPTTTTTTSNDLPGLPDNDETMALGDLLGSALGEVSLRDDAEVRSTSDLMDLDSNQDPKESTVGQEQLVSEMETVVDDSGDAGPLTSLSPEMDWEGEEGSDIAMCDVEALPAPPTALAPSTLAPLAALAPFTTPVAHATPDTQAEEADKPQEELDELERDLIAAFEENDSSDVETVLHVSPSPPHHTLPSTNDAQPPLVDPALFASTVPTAPQSSTNQAAENPDEPQEASQAEMAKRHILKPRSRRSKDTGSAPSQSRQTSLQSVSENKEQEQEQAVMDNTAQNLVLLAGLTSIPVGDSTQPQQTTPVAPPSAVQETTVKSATTRGNNPTPPLQPQQNIPTSTAANQPAHIPAVQNGSLTLPGGNNTTNPLAPTPSPQPQQNVPSPSAANQPETVPTIQMGGLTLPRGNRIANTPTPPPPPQPQPTSTGTKQPAHVPAIHMGGLILPGGNSSITTPTPTTQQDAPKPNPSPQGPPRKGSILSDTLITDSPEQMTPSQTPGRRDSTPAGTPKDLGEAELQRAIRRQQAKKGKKPQLFHSKRSNASSSATTSSPTTPIRQGSTDTAMEAESSDAAAQRLLSGSSSKKKVTVVQSLSVPQNLRDQERDHYESQRESLRRNGDL
ncbi:Hypothetical protein NCS54_00146800 [Fusarium falciforme]|uniref:Hypothetical protein n=1 Tax=Fusarium falciforme TaxID=195108 RepID=UPI0023016E02|nr:Hypothetical protein NCS54_00146800 [Fusarium falciforme]WAO84259.1 Hypothetical protein NCS54_00146800 [Fusarium falciforme]